MAAPRASARRRRLGRPAAAPRSLAAASAALALKQHRLRARLPAAAAHSAQSPTRERAWRCQQRACLAQPQQHPSVRLAGLLSSLGGQLQRTPTPPTPRNRRRASARACGAVPCVKFNASPTRRPRRQPDGVKRAGDRSKRRGAARASGGGARRGQVSSVLQLNHIGRSARSRSRRLDNKRRSNEDWTSTTTTSIGGQGARSCAATRARAGLGAHGRGTAGRPCGAAATRECVSASFSSTMRRDAELDADAQTALARLASQDKDERDVGEDDQTPGARRRARVRRVRLRLRLR